MMTSSQIAQAFYQAFQKKDFKIMQGLYADNATFSDPAFPNLNAQEVRAMWEMLLTASKDLHLEYQILEETAQQVKTQWIATYTFSKTGRKVINKIVATMDIENGLIVSHTDDFSFYKWASQALGPVGLLLGWTGFLRKKLQTTARQNLANFMQKAHSRK
ncbi:MAG: nuclear transport factor 2 family protein [Sphingobacteriia bacterium]|nr:MAG: nuclear transport factor 2 family protein [Sphingobacteriia bacterium]